MAEAEYPEAADAGEDGVSATLRRARLAAGLTLGDISARTRIAERHLAAIDEARFGDLASRTYAVGFARAYARTLGLDEQEIANGVRAEMAATQADDRPRPATFEPGDPARVPSTRVAWLAGLGIIAVLVAVWFTWRDLIAPAGELPAVVADAPPAAPAPAAVPTPAQFAAPSANVPANVPPGPVVFTATEQGIWVKFYDAAGKQLMQKQMSLNESYTVPPDADGPRVWTGRPDALRITVGGQPVAPLAPRQTIVKNVPVSAAALLARGVPAAVASDTASAGPTLPPAMPAPAATP